MGLRFRSLEGWERWDESRHRLRRVKARLVRGARREAEQPLVITHGDREPSVVAAVDVARGTSLDALVAPLRHLKAGAIVTRGPLPEGVAPSGWRSATLESAQDLPSSVKVVLSAGSYRAVSLPLHAVTRARGARFVVVQHGILTPWAVPLPPECELLAWNAAEAMFWTEGRPDVDARVVGSQLLWNAAEEPARELESERPLWLGQLHGTELSKRSMARAAERFCLGMGATYRAHPAERGIRERAIHAAWRRKGMAFDDASRPLAAIARPVASIFSTGILEAAARGLPAWGFHPEPPRWVEELWDRLGIARYGEAPTHVELPESSPSESVAALIDE